MPKNPLSRTTFKFTKDRIQHFSEDLYICDNCEDKYNPKVHSQPYIIQFGVIILGILILVIFLTKLPMWMYIALPVPILAYFIYYHNKDRRVITTDGPNKIKYGDIVLDCPKCGNKEATKDM